MITPKKTRTIKIKLLSEMSNTSDKIIIEIKKTLNKEV